MCDDLSASEFPEHSGNSKKGTPGSPCAYLQIREQPESVQKRKQGQDAPHGCVNADSVDHTTETHNRLAQTRPLSVHSLYSMTTTFLCVSKSSDRHMLRNIIENKRTRATVS